MILALVILHFILWQYVFGFQRLTLRYAKILSEQTGFEINECQTLITPNGIGKLGWVNRFFSIFLIVIILGNYGIGAVGVFIFMVYIGGYAAIPVFRESYFTKNNRHITIFNNALQQAKKSVGGMGRIAIWRIEEALSADNTEQNDDGKKAKNAK